jgi:hypothetical protein
MTILGRTPATARFAPESVRRFRFRGWDLQRDTGCLDLAYGLEGATVDIRLHEGVDLGGPLPPPETEAGRALQRAVRLLHLVAGVSYYKTSFAPEVVVDGGPVTPATADLLAHLYGEGLAECRYVNGLSGRRLPDFAASPAAALTPAPPVGLPDRPLVAVGGGKDSIVALEAVRRTGRSPLLFAVGDSPAVSRTVAVARLPRVAVHRTLDPLLHELNRQGAYNGHVPVTAITCCLGVIAALVHGASEVVMADERSASTGSLTWDGTEVNHQYSKGWDLERRLAAVVHAEVAADLDCFSLLRPWSELAIVRSFAGMPEYHRAFVSCNRAYRLDPATRSASWCGDCPKCRFVALALAPFLDRDKVVSIIGHDVLGDPAQLPGFAALLGLEGVKPLECVGEVEESRVAMRLISERQGWCDAAVVRVLARDPRVADLPESVTERVMSPAAEHALPAHYRGLAAALP